MLGLSSKTEVNRQFKTGMLLKLMGADKDVRADAKKINSVTLTNVINNSSMNFNTESNIKEIYIFCISLCEKTLPELFISALDKYTAFHTLFVLEYDDEYMLYGALKTSGDNGLKRGRYFYTQWNTAKPSIVLPASVIDLNGIYAAIIDMLVPVKSRQNENAEELVFRYTEILRLEKEIQLKQKQVNTECQPKRRFALNDELKNLKEKLNELQGENYNG